MPRLINALLALTIAVLVGCSPDQPTEPEPSPTPTATAAETVVEPTPSSTHTGSPTDPATPNPSPSLTLSPDQQAAVDAVMEYFRLQEEVDADLDADLQPLMEITDGNMRRIVTDIVSSTRALGQVTRGSSIYSVHRVDDPKEVEGETQIVVFACMDSTKVETVDAATGELADATPPRFVDYRLVTADRNGWKLIDGGNKEVESCP